jgi:hypothetical protein
MPALPERTTGRYLEPPANAYLAPSPDWSSHSDSSRDRFSHPRKHPGPQPNTHPAFPRTRSSRIALWVKRSSEFLPPL